MAFGPYPRFRPRLDDLMFRVSLALLPGGLIMGWQWGWGLLFQLFIALMTAWGCEALVMIIRGRPTLPTLRDGSAMLTAVLLALSLPPLTPWWVTVTGAILAIVLAKHLYGGLGHNLFNPAMVAYAVLLVSFPRIMTTWPLAPRDMVDTGRLILGLSSFDGLTGATPLDAVKTQWAQTRESGLLPHFDPVAPNQVWVNLGFLLGGLWLLSQRLIDWRIPLGFLGGLLTISLIAYLAEPQHYPTPLFQLSAGATQLGAFFIATDPVTAATTPRGRWIYAGGAGVIVAIIRLTGSYADGVAFAILLMNFTVPTLDRYTRPRVYGTRS